MDIEAISGAGVVAGTCALLFLIVAKAWTSLSSRVHIAPNFANSITYEAAQRLRNKFDRISTSQSVLLGGALVFAVLFAAAYLLDAGQLFAGYPDWQLKLQIGFLTLVVAFAAYRLAVTAAERRHVRFLRDASIAIGHRLQHCAPPHSRIIHDIETPAGVIDHVVVSRTGLYAVSVVAKRVRGCGSVRIDGSSLVYSTIEGRQPVADVAARAECLADEFQQLLGYKVRVRSVIAVPGWSVSDPENEGTLIVNEKDISKLADWKSDAEQLMHDDADRLIEAMTAKSPRPLEILAKKAGLRP